MDWVDIGLRLVSTTFFAVYLYKEHRRVTWLEHRLFILRRLKIEVE